MARGSEIGVGLVGYGLAGQLFHSPFIAATDGLEIRAIATSNPERQARAAADHPGAVVLGTVDELLGRDGIDVVVVVTPNRFHAPIGTRALEHGHHVVVDKPIAMTVPEGEALLDVAERTGRILCVYQNRRWDAAAQTVRKLVGDGVFGEIDSYEARFERWLPVGPEWRDRAEEAGGPLRDLGSHLADQALLLFGPARRVWAQLDRRRPGSEVDDAVFVAIDHASGVRSRLWMSLTAPAGGPHVRVRGLDAEYIKHDLDIQEPQLFEGRRPPGDGFGDEPEERWGTLTASDGSTQRIPTVPGRWQRFWELFRDAVRGDGPPPVDPRDSVRVLEVLDAAERSAATGEAQSLEPALR